MKTNTLFFWVFAITIGTAFVSCETFLDAKPDKVNVVPAKLSDLQALIDATGRVNIGQFPSLLEIGTDDYVVSSAVFANLTEFERDNYRWASNPIYLIGNVGAEWSKSYNPVLVANTVLEYLPKVADGDERRADAIRGAALFLRAFSFFHLAQVFCAPYEMGGKNDAAGIPIRLKSDLNERTERASIDETYRQIIGDLMESIPLLPDIAEFPTRPTRAASLALLARTYLAMEDYERAGEFADRAIAEYDVLMDYNRVDVQAPNPFMQFNDETIYYATTSYIQMLHPSEASVSPELYELYHDNDLRKVGFFMAKDAGEIGFKGSYDGRQSGSLFVGLTTAELFLISAECAVRMGDVNRGMDALNHLLAHRWKEGTFSPYSADNEADALSIILEERRKELLFRGVRWSDLRRLNRDARYAKTLTREVDGEMFTLPPNDLRYVFLIPQDVIDLTGIPQNQR